MSHDDDDFLPQPEMDGGGESAKPVKTKPKFGGKLDVGPTSAEWRKEYAASGLSPYVTHDGRFAAGLKFTKPLKKAYCDIVARTGRLADAAKECGIKMDTVRHHRREDPDFAADLKEAEELYADLVRKAVQDYALNGTQKPIYYQGKVVGFEKVVYQRLVELEAKRIDPAYRDKGAEVNVNVNTGVLAIPAPVSADDWEKQFAKPAIDVTPSAPKLTGPDEGDA